MPTRKPKAVGESTTDGRKLVKTSTPGIYKRLSADGRVTSYVVTYRAAGKQRRDYAKTLDEARRLKRSREAERDRGEWQPSSTLTLHAFLREWIDEYAGNGKTTFRDSTRTEYRRLLDTYVFPYFGDRMKLAEITPRHLSRFVSHLADEKKIGRQLADSSIRNAVMPLRAALADAKRQGLIRHNPADGLVFPKRASVQEDDAQKVKALSEEELRMLIALVHSEHRLLVELVATTGLRISEALALRAGDLQLDGGHPHLLVRRALVKGKIVPPKSRYGRRTVRLPLGLADRLRASTDPSAETNLVFATRRETPHDADNLRKRYLKPAGEEAGVGWAGWHSLRHTYASIQLARGTNVLQLSRALGHHSPAFTLEVYCHLLPGDEAPALELAPDKRGSVDRATQLAEDGREVEVDPTLVLPPDDLS